MVHLSVFSKTLIVKIQIHAMYCKLKRVLSSNIFRCNSVKFSAMQCCTLAVDLYISFCKI